MEQECVESPNCIEISDRTSWILRLKLMVYFYTLQQRDLAKDVISRCIRDILLVTPPKIRWERSAFWWRAFLRETIVKESRT